MRLPPMNAIRAFEAAARHGGYIDAGEELHVSKGAISRHVKLLEQYLGVPLFHRRTNGVDLTPTGRALAATLTETLGRISDEAERLRVGAQDLRVICPPATSIRWLLPRLSRFRERHPDIRLRLTTDFHSDGGFQIEEFDVGFSVVNWRRSARPLEVAPLFPVILTPACAPTLAPSEVDGLANLPLLHETSERHDWTDWLETYPVPGVDVQTGDVFANLDIAAKAAVMGSGVVMADKVLCAEELSAGTLVTPFPDMTVESRFGDICLIGAAEVWESRKVRAFRAWLLEEAEATRASVV